jgi:antitoxin ParD1/3/4
MGRLLTAQRLLSASVSQIGIGEYSADRGAMTRRASLNVSLTPELVAFVAAQVASGRYACASEVVRAALRCFEREAATGQQSLGVVSSRAGPPT